MTGVSGKTVIILGASGGMGKVISWRFAREGAKVMVAGRNIETLKALAAEIKGEYIRCDITQKKDLEALVDAAVDRMGRVDVAINATGFGLLKPFLDTTPQELEQMTAVQFIGPFQFIQELVKVMKTGGSIIQISSATATIMLENHAAYMGTKAGIDHVIRCVANEFGERGIRANSISPGLTNTPMAAMAFQNEAVVELFRKEYPWAGLGQPKTLQKLPSGWHRTNVS